MAARQLIRINIQGGPKSKFHLLYTSNINNIKQARKNSGILTYSWANVCNQILYNSGILHILWYCILTETIMSHNHLLVCVKWLLIKIMTTIWKDVLSSFLKHCLAGNSFKIFFAYNVFFKFKILILLYLITLPVYQLDVKYDVIHETSIEQNF